MSEIDEEPLNLHGRCGTCHNYYQPYCKMGPPQIVTKWPLISIPVASNRPTTVSLKVEQVNAWPSMAPHDFCVQGWTPIVPDQRLDTPPEPPSRGGVQAKSLRGRPNSTKPLEDEDLEGTERQEE